MALVGGGTLRVLPKHSDNRATRYLGCHDEGVVQALEGSDDCSCSLLVDHGHVGCDLGAAAGGAGGAGGYFAGGGGLEVAGCVVQQAARMARRQLARDVSISFI